MHGRTAILRSIAMEDGRSHHQFNDSKTLFRGKEKLVED